jgi:hypothetical protein
MISTLTGRKIGQVERVDKTCFGDEASRQARALALSLVLLYQRVGDEKFERAARRWVRRAQIRYSLKHREVELLRAALGALGTRFDRVALTALIETCRELRLPSPTHSD